MAFLEDYQSIFEQDEKRKKLLGNALKSLDNFGVDEEKDIYDPFAPVVEEDIPDIPMPRTPEQGMLDKYLLEPLGAFTWGVAEAGTLADVWVPKKAREDFVLLDEHPEGMPGKIAAGAGHLVGFVGGAPMKIVGKGVSGLTRLAAGIAAKRTGSKLGEKYAIGSASKIGKNVVKKAQQSGIDKKLAQETVRRVQNKAIMSRFTKQTAEQYAKRMSTSVDEITDLYITTGKLSAVEARTFGKLMKDNLGKKPIQDLTDILVSKGINPFTANIATEMLLFGAIDLVDEGLRSKAGTVTAPLDMLGIDRPYTENRDYDWTRPLWGGLTGLGFGTLKKIMPVMGKGAKSKRDFVQGIKAAFSKDPFTGKPVESLKHHSKWLSDVLDDAGESVMRSGEFNGKRYALNLKNPEHILHRFGETDGKKIIASELNKIKRSHGRKLAGWAIREEAASMVDMWKRMVGSSIVMNARTIWDVVANDAEPTFDDVLPSILIGAWVGRHGQPRKWDMNKRVNKIRQGLKTLGVNTDNLGELPTFNKQYTSPLNPMANHEGMVKISKRAEDLEIISENYDAVRSESPGVKVGEQSVAGYNADPQSTVNLDVFHAVYNNLRAGGKYIRSLDDISVSDAIKLQETASGIKWSELNGEPITSHKDMNIILDNIAEGASERFENLLIGSTAEIGRKLGIPLDETGTVIGKLPSILTYSREIEAAAFRGELEFLRDAEGNVLNGNDAIAAFQESLHKTSRVFEFLSDPERGIGRATKSNISQEITEPAIAADIHEIINKLEYRISTSAGIKDNRSFSLIDNLDELAVPMLQNQAKKAAKGLSNLFDINNPDTDAVGKLQLMLKKVKLLKGAVTSPGGRVSDLTLLPDISKIKITGAKDEAQEAQAKKILGNVLSLVGAKGQYKLGSRPSQEIEVPYSSVVGDSEQSLSTFLERRGMRTAPYLMEQYNTFTTNYILREKIKGSNLETQHIDFIHTLMDIGEVPFAQFAPGGKGKAAGWAVSKVELTPGASETNQTLAKQYNNYVDELIKAGQSERGDLIASGPLITAVNPELANLITTAMHYSREGSRAQAKESLLHFLNATELNHGAFKMMVSEFINSGNSGNAVRMLQWLQKYKLISRSDSNGLTKYSLNANKTIEPAVIQQLMSKMNKFGISREAAERMQQISVQEVNDMEFNHMGIKTKDQRLTRDQFFDQYFSHDESSKTGEGQETILISSLYDGNGDVHPNAVNNLLSKMTTTVKKKQISTLDLQKIDGGLQKLREARDDAQHIVLGQLANENRIFFTYNNGNLKAENKKVVSTPLYKAVNNLGVSMIPILGSNQLHYTTPRGKIRNGRFSIFDAESDYIPTNTKNILKDNLTNLKNSLNSLSEINVKNAPMGLYPGEKDIFQVNTSTGDPGMILVRLMDTIQPFAMLKSDLPNIVVKYENLIDRLKADDTIQIDPKAWNTMTADLTRLKSNPESHMAEHERALRTLLFEQLTTSSQDKSVFVDLLNGNRDLAKVASRFSLFHTPAYRYAEADFAANNITVTKYEKRIADKYAKKGNAGVVIWNDKKFADIYENLSSENQRFWDSNMYGRGSESMFDSISFISEEYRDYLALSHGMTANADSRIFKPVISSNGDVLLFGKTAFVVDPSLKGFFKTNPGVDILTTKSASKIYGEKEWKLLDASQDELLAAKNLKANGFVKEIPLNAIGIKSDKVKDVDAAKISQQVYNYLNSSEAGKIYNDMYDPHVENALNNIKTLLDNPFAMRQFFTKNTYEDTFIETMVEGTGGSQRLGALRVWADYGNPMEIGESIVMSQIYRKVIEPILAPKAEIDGIRYGGKAVMMQSLDPKYRDLRFTKVDKDGKLSHYGEIVLPHNDQFESIRSITGKDKDLKVKVLDTKNNKLLDPKEVLGDNWENVSTLGDLHTMLGGDKANYQVAIINTRYPRTRPNDLGILGLRGFGDKSSGNSAIVNPVDVLNIFEGDYDIDKADYFWAQNETLYKHVENSKQRFIQGIDPEVFPSSIKGLKFYNNSAMKENELWQKQISNASTLGRGIGLVQKVPRIINHIRDLAESRLDESGKERNVIMEGDGWEIIVDYNNKDWFQRMVLEAQTIIDAGASINKDVLDQVYEWREDFLFPLMQDSPQGSWNTITDKVGFLRETQGGRSPSRIRIFRKFDTKNQKEVDLSVTDREILKTLMKNHSDFVQLGTEVYDNTGRGKGPSYNDVIDLSGQYFTYLEDLSNSVYWKLHSKRTPTGKLQMRNLNDFTKMFDVSQDPKDAILRKDAKYRRDFQKIEPEPGDYYYLPRSDKGPFPEAVIHNARNVSSGSGGNVFDRIMWKVWDTDPMKAMDYKAFSADEMVQMEGAMKRFHGEGRYKSMDEFTANMLSFTTSVNKAQGTLRYLKRQYGVISKLRMPLRAKQRKIEQLNDAQAKIEDKILMLTSAKYRKTKKGAELKEPLIKYVDLKNDKDVQDGAVQFYTMEALTRINGTKDMEGMRKELDELRKFEKVAFADMDGLSETYTYGEVRSFLSTRQRDWLGVRETDTQIYEIIQQKLEAGLARYGPSFLFHYGSPLAHKNAIGIYNGVPHPVAYGPTKRFNRAMTFIANKAQNDPTMKRTLQVIAPIVDHYRNYFQRKHQFLAEDMLIDPETGLNYEMLKFPKFQKTLQGAFDNFTSLKWNKATGKENPFQVMNDDLLNFYREIFKMNGQEAIFEQYAYQMSHINAVSMDSQLIDPFHYINLMNTMEAKTHAFMKQGFDGGFSPDGKFVPTESMKNNPIWALLGGEQHIKGISMNPLARASEGKWKSMIDYGKQANDLKTGPPKFGKSKEIFDLAKKCRGK